ncbi:transposase [Actinomadura montaniterrae]|uniref:Transposase n=1 Tax=Actinomadura montaniterrae TaxID=1803903 RepID=A0A6L3W1M5_9ACTN|nr:transposase [Actinomadura montaniterrae]
MPWWDLPERYGNWNTVYELYRRSDKAYSSAAIRRSLRVRGIAATIPELADQKAGRAAADASSNGAASPPAPTNSARNYRAAIVLVTALLWNNT